MNNDAAALAIGREVLRRLGDPADRTTVGENGCLLWKASKTGGGYGAYTISFTAHRLAVLLRGEDLDPDLTVEHTCGNRACWNEGHLVQTTQADNNRRIGLRTGYCRSGAHLMIEDNVYVRPDTGTRSCKACRRIKGNETYYRNHEYRKAKNRTMYHNNQETEHGR